MIYFDNSATTVIKPKEVSESVYHVLNSGSYGNPGRDSSSYSLNSSELIYETRCLINDLFNGQSEDNVIFTKNVTEGLNLVINGLFTKGDHIITTNYEHNSVIRPLERLKKENTIDVSYVPFDVTSGELDLDFLKSVIREETKAIICTHVSNVTGYILPIEEISRVCKKNNLLFILDAAQSAGIEDIDLKKVPADIICFTGHKSLYGPQGVGGLYINNSSLNIRPLLTGGSGFDSFNKEMPEVIPNKFEAGTMNTPGIAGLKAGIEYINNIGLSVIREKLSDLSSQILKELNKYEKISVYTRESQYSPSIVAFNVEGMDSAEVTQYLWDYYQIATRGGAHCAPLVHESYDTKEQGIVRISLSYFNNDNEVQNFLNAIKKLIKELGN